MPEGERRSHAKPNGRAKEEAPQGGAREKLVNQRKKGEIHMLKIFTIIAKDTTSNEFLACSPNVLILGECI